MKNPSRQHRRPEQWQALILQWQRSELSALSFCKRHDLGYASFCQWRKRLETQRTADALPVTTPPTDFVELGACVAGDRVAVPSVPLRFSLRLSLGSVITLSIDA